MKKQQYDLNFKKMVVAKGKKIGNMTVVARQHELDPSQRAGFGSMTAVGRPHENGASVG
ncbi:hypothetical protein PF010_g32050 [Phytophthora fragariae]|uniref:Transposase n=1 Tax=Phytophthora fragariae TaxID=53985 RepID=A0A6G0JFS6_9STRA|nr:hypothetical protein PF010_g32050 [Phytophthora fragariae]